MRLTITCDCCGHRQRTERKDYKVDDRVNLVCHQCEEPLVVEVQAEPVAREVYRQAMAR